MKAIVCLMVKRSKCWLGYRIRIIRLSSLYKQITWNIIFQLSALSPQIDRAYKIGYCHIIMMLKMINYMFTGTPWWFEFAFEFCPIAIFEAIEIIRYLIIEKTPKHI